MQFDSGFHLLGHIAIPKLLTISEIELIRAAISGKSGPAAGDRRLLDHQWCRELVPAVRDRLLSKMLTPDSYVAVLCTYFDKSGETNWGVAPHRDVCVPMSKKFDQTNWSNWSCKQGIPHVQPPRAFLSSMFAVRINIDASNQENGALIIASGSHRNELDDYPETVVVGNPGDALMMNPLLRHASHKSISGLPRRVLHFLFGPEEIDIPGSWYYSV